MIKKWNTWKSNCMFSSICVSKVVCACVNLRVYVLNAYLRSRSLIPTAFAWWLLLCNVYQNLMHVTVALNLNMIRHKNSLWQTKTWAQKQTYYSQHMKSRNSRPGQQVPVAVVQTVATLWCSAPEFVPNGSSRCWSWSAAEWKGKSRHGEVHGEAVGKAVGKSARPWQWWSQVSASCCSSSGWWRPSTTSAYWFTEGCIVRQYAKSHEMRAETLATLLSTRAALDICPLFPQEEPHDAVVEQRSPLGLQQHPAFLHLARARVRWHNLPRP